MFQSANNVGNRPYHILLFFIQVIIFCFKTIKVSNSLDIFFNSYLLILGPINIDGAWAVRIEDKFNEF